MLFKGQEIHTVIEFYDGSFIIFAGQRSTFAVTPGHPDWNDVRKRLDKVCLIRAQGETNHSAGLYYLGNMDKIEFPE